MKYIREYNQSDSNIMRFTIENYIVDNYLYVFDEFDSQYYYDEKIFKIWAYADIPEAEDEEIEQKRIIASCKDFLKPYGKLARRTVAKVGEDFYEIKITITIEKSKLKPLFKEVLFRMEAEKYNL